MGCRAVRIKSEEGFSLAELMPEFALRSGWWTMAVLITISIPTFMGYRARAHDTDAQTLIRTTILTENVFFLDNGVYTDAAADLEDIESSIRVNVSGNPAGTVRLVVGSPADQVCLFSHSESDTWFAVYHTESDTLYGNSAPATCQASLATGWSTDGW